MKFGFLSLSLTATGESKSFAVGHFALGYIVAKALGKPLKVNLNIPLVLTLSIIPDMDIMIGWVLLAVHHRGQTHSIIIAFLVFIPIFAVYKITAVPYFAALVQHSLVGDYLVGGKVQLFWPLTLQGYGNEWLDVTSPTNVAIEWSVFLVSMLIMLKTKDLQKLFVSDKKNIILVIPTITVLLPTFLRVPMYVPVWLIPPHLFYLVIFLASIAIGLRGISRILTR
jgi:membrane-bound metal-dependent hydrolase YbcI (DUF457 family)